MKIKDNFKTEYQTPPEVCRYMASLLPNHIKDVLEPTPGIGNLVKALNRFNVTAPKDYFLIEKSQKFDAVVMNPPFSASSAILDNAPKGLVPKGMKLGYWFLFDCMQRSDIIIALMPWFTLSDSDVRLRYLKKFGLKSITALPRKTFEFARIQTCVLELNRGYNGETEFKVFDFLPKIKTDDELLQIELFGV